MRHHAVELLAMFESYTSMASPFPPTVVVENPAETLRRSVRYWADNNGVKPRLASREPVPWALVAG